MMISVEIEDASLADGIGAVAGCLGLTGPDDPALPGWIAGPAALELSHAEAAIEREDDETFVIFAGFGLKLPGEWELVPHFLSVADLTLDLSVMSPDEADLREIEIRAGGFIGFAGAQIRVAARAIVGPAPPSGETLAGALERLNISVEDDELAAFGEAFDTDPEDAAIPRRFDFEIEGELVVPEKPVSFADVIGHFGWHPGGALAQAHVETLQMRMSTLTGEYAFVVEIGGGEGGIPIAGGAFRLTEIFLAVDGHSDGDIAGSLGGAIAFAGGTADVRAECDLSDHGWRFEGELVVTSAADLWDDVEERFAVTIPPTLKRIEGVEVHLAVDTGAGSVMLSLGGTLALSESLDAAIQIDVALERGASGWDVSFEGALDLSEGEDEEMRFDLAVESEAGGDVTLIATYADTSPERHDLAGLAARLANVGEGVPAGLSFSIPGAVFAHAGETSLLAFDIAGGIDLTAIRLPDLPMVAEGLGDELTASLGFQIVLASEDLKAEHPLRAQIAAHGFDLGEGAISSPVTLNARLQLGNDTIPIVVPAETKAAAFSEDLANSARGEGSASGTRAADPGGHWVDVHRRFGPVRIDRIGLDFGTEVTAMLDAGLDAFGLDVSLDGLRMTSPLDAFAPKFSFDGLGIDFRQDPVEIGGSFLRMADLGGFGGSIVARGTIKEAEFSLAAYGLFSEVDHQPSLFVYAVLDYPLGGPAFFFVTGLAAGFGLNREIRVPAAEGVRDFPLVQWAMPEASGTKPPESITAAIRDLGAIMPPANGEVFLAIGVAFTSFETVKSFALLIAKFGHRFELDLLGVSRLTSPPEGTGQNVPPVAQATVSFKARFVPDEGTLTLRAVLAPDSFVMSRDCHLQGGFAFSAWFRKLGKIEAGDFAITIGGYHPDFDRPGHYPTVPRIGVQWQVSPHLSIKGGAYFAMTGAALMAGGRLEAVWQAKNVRASFLAATDFLLTWKPYHYDVRVSVAISASVTIHFFGTHHLSFHARANVHIWGPEFSGEADIKVRVLGFDVAFHVSFRSSPSLSRPMEWDAFRDAFLPETPAAFSVRTGLVRGVKEGAGERWIVSPRDMVLAFETAIPLTRFVDAERPDASGVEVRPAAWTAGTFASEVASIEIRRDGVPIGREGFVIAPVRKGMPVGLWGKARTVQRAGLVFLEPPEVNEDRMVDALAGFTLAPATAPPALDTPEPETPRGLGAKAAPTWSGVPGAIPASAEKAADRRRALFEALAA